MKRNTPRSFVGYNERILFAVAMFGLLVCILVAIIIGRESRQHLRAQVRSELQWQVQSVAQDIEENFDRDVEALLRFTDEENLEHVPWKLDERQKGRIHRLMLDYGWSGFAIEGSEGTLYIVGAPPAIPVVSARDTAGAFVTFDVVRQSGKTVVRIVAKKDAYGRRLIVLLPMEKLADWFPGDIGHRFWVTDSHNKLLLGASVPPEEQKQGMVIQETVGTTGWAVSLFGSLAHVQAVVWKQIARNIGVLLVLWILFVAVVFAAGRSMWRDVVQLSEAAGSIGEGQYKVRLPVLRSPENALIATNVNAALDRLQGEIDQANWKSGLYRRASGNQGFEQFVEAIGSFLREQLAVEMVVIYLPDGEEYTARYRVGVIPERETFSFRKGEAGSWLAACCQQGEVCFLEDMPIDIGLAIATPTGDIPPESLAFVPLLDQENQANGLVVVGSIQPFQAGVILFLKSLAVELGLQVELQHARQKIEQSARDLISSYQELETTHEELASQTEELYNQTREMGILNRELERKNLEIQQASRAKSVFLTNVSHELRTPLNSIVTLVGLLHEQAADEHETRTLEVVHRNASLLLGNINRLLEFAKLESGLAKPDVTTFALADLFAELRQILAPLIKDAVALDIGVPLDLTMETDYGRLRSTLLSLLENSMKFTTKGKVSLRSEVRGDELILVVADSGPGISSEDLVRLMAPFHQGDESLARVHEGFGLGLSIAHSNVELLEGQLDIACGGEGTVVTIGLPIRLPRKQEEPVKEKSRGSKGSAHSATIQIYSRDSVVASELSDLLGGNGLQAKMADLNNDKDSLSPCELSILDFDSYGDKGFAVLESLQEGNTNLHPVLVITSELLKADDLTRLAKSGAACLMKKGEIEPAALLDEVYRLLGESGEEKPV